MKDFVKIIVKKVEKVKRVSNGEDLEAAVLCKTIAKISYKKIGDMVKTGEVET